MLSTKSRARAENGGLESSALENTGLYGVDSADILLKNLAVGEIGSCRCGHDAFMVLRLIEVIECG